MGARSFIPRDGNVRAAMALMILVFAGCMAARHIFLHSSRRACPMQVEKAVISSTFRADTSGSLLVGYNYFLLDKFIRDNGGLPEISLETDSDSVMDSLRTGSVDIVAFPEGYPVFTGENLYEITVDSLVKWVIPRNDRMRSFILSWSEEFRNSESYREVLSTYMDRYEPFTAAKSGVKVQALSPYDSLLRQYADSLQWDWRFLAAMVYQESHFRIEALSHKGAGGLMQIMGNTADNLGITNRLDPEQSIRGASSYLRSLQRRYRGITADPAERRKFAIAAYNAGEGRISDVITFARLNGTPLTSWDDAEKIIPMMCDSTSALLDSLKYGTFDGTETINHVRRTLDLYWALCTICPKE
ncbi:MAG: transglycosylase SLT domain-containing protein [Bacteroidales bacterium]|nr:transglycosylase SLT domain-containing protein [Bacteroidales bacterium]